MFGRDDVRKFCFYIFDKDKNGYIEQDELTALIDMLHEVSLVWNELRRANANAKLILLGISPSHRTT